MKKIFQGNWNRLTAKITLLAVAASGGLVGCNKNDSSFSTLPTSKAFSQATINNKVDILWVIDNSLSMDPLQQNLINNYSAFMTTFKGKNFDYQMAVTTSDAYLAAADYRNDPALAKFRDGAGTSHSGVFVVTPSDPDPLATFMININQGQFGGGDERVFQSLLDSLKSPLNTGFFRTGAFHAVVILSDEDDFSNYSRWEGTGGDHNYAQTGLLSVDDVISQLDAITGSTSTKRNYNVSAITVMDSACQAQHSANAPSAIVGTRYIDIVNRTNGVLGSVCDSSFASSLQNIQEKIIELSTLFPLDREPDVKTIRVAVNGQFINQDEKNGWTYLTSENAIQFHGSAVPPAGASIQVYYDPATLL